MARNNLHRHLLNAELFSLRSWTHHPVRSLARLIPLRVKERINQAAGRPIFDLAFYLQFQPNSVIFGDVVLEPLMYYPKLAHGRKRVALVTTQLGPGGAEQVLCDIASTLATNRFETLLLATQSQDDRWLPKWRQSVEHVYDLAKVVPPEKMIAALCSVISNWRCDYLLLQNSLYGYAAIPHIKKMLPGILVFDMIHAVDDAWDQMASTAGVAAYIDLRVAMTRSVRDRLLALGTSESKILLVRNGVDLEHFQPTPVSSNSPKNILFAATPGCRQAAAVCRRYRPSAFRPPPATRFSIRHRGRWPREATLRAPGPQTRAGCNSLISVGESTISRRFTPPVTP